MTIRCAAVLVWACVLPVTQAQPVINAAVNAASYEASLAPGCWMSIFGTNLAAEERQAAAVPLPDSLAGVSVAVNGIAAPLLFVSPGQINALVPFEIQVSGDRITASVTVTTPQGTSAAHSVFLSASAPAIYTRDMSGRGPGFVMTPGFQLLDSIAPGEIVVMYAAGLGQTDPPAESHQGGADAEPYNRVPAKPEVWIGDRQAEVLFAGLAPGFPGIYQLNVRLPDTLGSDRMLLRAGLAQSNIAQVGIPAGQNTANVTGIIAGIFPSDGTDPRYPPVAAQDFSLMPQAVQFSVSMDIVPGAGKFTITATGESGKAVITIDPGQGTWESEATTPATPVRYGDYSALLPVLILDYRNCLQTQSGLSCTPLPGNMMPMSRMDPGLPRAMSLLPEPNSDIQGGIGTVRSSGALPPDGHFAIDEQTNSALGFFGGLASIPLGYLDTRIAPLRLYVDGKLIASKDISYNVVKRPN